ncbi:lysozyme [Leucothrix pacifica]|uniref:Lysozyme n=1 Tax=Leucothrix pacifica TaxID=1247513 RepID=A0A317CEU3_9GAMM|nr:lysozyme [Leucothrix pacifica]PWQ94830.1 hypothetical protein DKW60_16450 [Leucothrix pacifica]
MMKMSRQGIRTLIDSEDSVNVVYNDQAGLPTIGVGHCMTQSEVSSGKIELSDGSVIDLRKGRISKANIERLLADDLIPREKAVNRMVKVTLDQYQFDALVHFVFNVGTGAFQKSTLLKRLNAGDYDAVPDEIRKWNIVTIGGQKQVSRGLANRREVECSMWEEGCSADSAAATTSRKRRTRTSLKSSGKRKSSSSSSSSGKSESKRTNDASSKHSKPAYQSKIIALAVTTGVTYLGTKYGIEVPAEWRSEIESGIVVAGLAGVAVLRRWYTDQDLH